MKFKKLPFGVATPDYTDLPKIERKRIRLLLVFCTVWIIQMFISLLVSIFVYHDLNMIFGHVFNCICLLFIFYFLYKKKQQIALILFISLVLVTTVLFTNFLSPAMYAEYFYLFIGPLTLIFTEKKSLILIGFITSYLAFIIPNKIYHIYPDQYYQDDYFSFVLFVIVLFLVYYFKSNNSKNENLLEQKTLELKELNQFQSQFFINISHEIKTPLTLLKGQVDKLDNTQNIAQTKEKIHIQIDNIKKIVDDVIDLSKMSDNSFHLNKEVIDLKKLVSKIHASFHSLFAQKEITFSLINTDDDCCVLADTLYLERAINNIILNAYKYTPKKGEVIIKLLKNNSKILLSISDTGIGIEEKNISKIFNRFYQVNNDLNKSGGSGVGLAFTKEIVELLDGKISVESKMNSGTIFNLCFPFVNDYKCINIEGNKCVNPHKELVKLNIGFDKNKIILVVDDSYEMRSYLKELLQDYTCVEAENGVEALTILKSKKIDLIVTDYMMPMMNGLELIEHMQEQNMVVPTLMLTARSDYNSKIQVLSLGINDYLSKPFEKDELLIRIHNILQNYNDKNNFILEQGISNTELKENVQWITKLKRYIEEHCENTKLNQTDIAEHFNVSKSTFYRKVKMETGLTPTEFITEVKLLKAREITEQETDISLKELSLKVGFLHTSYFATQYKKRFGVHPVKQLEH